ncbi:MAG: hypothetical protein ACE5GL_01455 [Calditrichia bacterium]
MKNLRKNIYKTKRREAKEIRKNFKADLLKAAAISTGGEFRSVEVLLKETDTLKFIPELRPVLFPEKSGIVNFKPATIAKRLSELGNLAGMVVPTDSTYLGGDVSWPNLIRLYTPAPVIVRDFYVEPVQVYRTRAIGADALLIDLDYCQPEAIQILADATMEMGLEFFIELNSGNLASSPLPPELSGIILNMSPAELKNAGKSFLRDLRVKFPGNPVFIARCLITSAEDALLAGSMGFSGIMSNNEYWQQKNPFESFRTVGEWCSKNAVEKLKNK